MKKEVLLFLSILFCSMFVFAGNKDKRVHPNNATHYIKGDFSARMVDGKPLYQLSDVTTEGMSFAQSLTYEGVMTDLGDLQFTFDSVRTTYPGGFAENELAFWYYDKEIGEWQPDIETRQATGSFENRKIKTIMLVLDCSTSLDKDFPKVQASAKSFLHKLYTVSNTGNVRVGVIGFSSLANTDKSILPILPLNDTNYKKILEFIGNLKTANGTALYYAIDRAVTMMDGYANALQGEDYTNYSGSCLVTFTDGIDQTSQDPSQGILNADTYYEKIKNEVMTHAIRGSRVDNYIIAVEGIDMTSPNIIAKFDRVLSSLTATDKYMKIMQFSELKSQFEKIAEELINSWQLLNCYVPAARQGLVCWTLGEVKPEKEKTRTMLLGLQLGVGVPMFYNELNSFYRWEWGLDIDFGFDMVYPVTNKFGLGFYFNFGNGFTTSMDCDGVYKGYYYDELGYFHEIYENEYYFDKYFYAFSFAGGIEMTFGDINNKGAFLLGLGTGYNSTYNYDNIPIDLRLGGVFKNGFYFFTRLNYSPAYFAYGYNYESWHYDAAHFIKPSIHFGYNFGNLFKVK